MGKKAFIGVSSKARQAKKMYLGVNGKARKVKKGFIGVGGKAYQFLSSDPTKGLYEITGGASYRRINDTTGAVINSASVSIPSGFSEITTLKVLQQFCGTSKHMFFSCYQTTSATVFGRAYYAINVLEIDSDSGAIVRQNVTATNFSTAVEGYGWTHEPNKIRLLGHASEILAYSQITYRSNVAARANDGIEFFDATTGAYLSETKQFFTKYMGDISLFGINTNMLGKYASEQDDDGTYYYNSMATWPNYTSQSITWFKKNISCSGDYTSANSFFRLGGRTPTTTINVLDIAVTAIVRTFTTGGTSGIFTIKS